MTTTEKISISYLSLIVHVNAPMPGHGGGREEGDLLIFFSFSFSLCICVLYVKSLYQWYETWCTTPIKKLITKKKKVLWLCTLPVLIRWCERGKEDKSNPVVGPAWRRLCGSKPHHSWSDTAAEKGPAHANQTPESKRGKHRTFICRVMSRAALIKV